jgi:hypothetical protein
MLAAWAVGMWALAIGVFVLAAVIAAAAWTYFGDSRLDRGLTDEEIAVRLAPYVTPLVVAELVVNEAEDDYQEPIA